METRRGPAAGCRVDIPWRPRGSSAGLDRVANPPEPADDPRGSNYVARTRRRRGCHADRPSARTGPRRDRRVRRRLGQSRWAVGQDHCIVAGTASSSSTRQKIGSHPSTSFCPARDMSIAKSGPSAIFCVAATDAPRRAMTSVTSLTRPARCEPAETKRGAPGAARIFRGGASRPRRGCHVDIPWRRGRGRHVDRPQGSTASRTRPSPRTIRAGATASPARGDAATADVDRSWARTGSRRDRRAETSSARRSSIATRTRLGPRTIHVCGRSGVYLNPLNCSDLVR